MNLQEQGFRGLVTRSIPAMPMTSKEKQEAFRARNAMLGLTEVRGIFLPPALHAQLKQLAADLLKKQEKK